MKNKFLKQGFTLIELLAAIIIILVIIVIAVPLITNIKEIVKREAFRAMAYSIADAGRLLIANENESQGYQEFYYLDSKEYNADGWKLDYSGTGPRTGVVVLNERSKVAMAIHNGTYCAIKSTDTNKVTVTKTAPDDCNAYSIIETCDTWEQIAIKYDVSLANLLAANNETDETSSTCDRNIKIPVTSTSSGSSYASGDGGSKVYYKTYYTMGYVSTSVTLPRSYEYTIKLGVLPLNIANIEVTRVTTQSVFESLDDFKRYITKRNMGEVIWPGETPVEIDISQASVFRDHAARNANMTADDVSVMCDTEACYATVSATVDNLTNVNPNTIEGVGQVAYTPIKFTVEFNGEGDSCTVRTSSDAEPGTLAGTGASTDPYLIESVEDLVALSNNVNAGNTYSGKYISITNSFDFNNNKSYKNTVTTTYGDINGNGTIEGLKTELTTGAGFIPIGNGTNKFRGQLLGNSNCIYNLYINRPEISYVGFVGYNYSGRITTLSLKDINVTGGSYTGGIVGYNNEGYIYESEAEGNVTGANYVGLAAGYLYKYSPAANATSIIVEGNVRGTNYVGGLVGFADDNIASTGYIGGVNKGGTVVSTGGTNVGRNFGGIDSRYVASSLSVADVTVNGSIVTSTSTTGVHGSDLQSLNDLNDINIAEAALDTYIGGDNDGSGYYWDYDDAGKIVRKNTVDDPLTFSLAGAGTAADPYLIGTYEDLRMATLKLGSVYKLTSNIDLSGKRFYMLGSYSHAFSGTLDGNDKTISNLTLDLPELTNVGFIGNLSGGTVKYIRTQNLNIKGGTSVGFVGNIYHGTVTASTFTNMNVTGLDYIGGIVGTNNEGSVYDSEIQGNVTGRNYVGLGAGYLYKYSPAANLRSVIVEGDATGNNYVGGLVGFADDTTASTGYVNGINKGGNINSVGAKVGRLVGALDSRYVLSGLSVDSVKINGATVTSDSVTSLHGVDIASMAAINNINLAEAALDTYIGGDNDGSGYYWDYDASFNVVRKKVADYPLTFTLSGAGTAADPYLINSYEDLRMATLKLGSVYKLNSDIDLTGKHYYVLGSYLNAFSGTLDGNWKTISNLSLNVPENIYIGFIGNLSGGTVKYLNAQNINITGGRYTGFIGNIYHGTVTASTFTNMNVTGLDYVGGIVGYNNEGNVYDSDMQGNVTGRNYIGLGAGYLYKYSPAANLRSVIVEGDVMGNNYIGGLVGFADDTTASTGYVNGINKGGSLVSIGTNIGRIVGGIDSRYVLSGLAVDSVTVNGAAVDSNSVTSIQGVDIASMAAINNINLAEAALDTYIGGDNDGSGYYWDYDASFNVVRKKVTDYPLTFSLSGAGTAADPYLINTYEDLRMATLKLGSVYKLNSDIDLTGKHYYMLGSYLNAFSGTLDGNWKTISNLSLDVPKNIYVGFAGNLSGGTIKSLNASNINITGGSYTGFVGGLYHATVTGSTFTNMNVTGLDYTGGIVGYNNEGNVNNCIISGTVTGNNSVGLAAGRMYKYSPASNVTAVTVNGDVSGNDYVGGIVGFADDNLASTGYISGVNIGGSVSSVGTNAGRIAGVIDSRFSVSTSSVDSVSVNGSTTLCKLNEEPVACTDPASKNGMDISSSDLSNTVTYTDRGFNFTDEALDYIWYIDGGTAKFRSGSL